MPKNCEWTFKIKAIAVKLWPRGEGQASRTRSLAVGV